MKKGLFILILFLGFLTAGKETVLARCDGSYTCGGWVQICTPGCTNRECTDLVGGCSWSTECDPGFQTKSCYSQYGTCSIGCAGGGGACSGPNNVSCAYTPDNVPPTPTPTPTPPPPGSCQYNACNDLRQCRTVTSGKCADGTCNCYSNQCNRDSDCANIGSAALDGYMTLNGGGRVGPSVTSDGGHCSGTASCDPPGPVGLDVGRCDNSGTCNGYGCTPIFTGVNINSGGTQPNWWCPSTIIMQGWCSVNAEGDASWWFCKNPVSANGLNFSFSFTAGATRNFQVTGVPPGYGCAYTFTINGRNTSGSGCSFTSPVLPLGTHQLVVNLVPPATISGRTYDSSSPGTSCSNLTGRPTLDGVAITTRNGATAVDTSTNSGSGGNYSFPNLPAGTYYFPSVTKTDSTLTLTCPSASQVIPPNTTVNFGLSRLQKAWLQTKDGDLHGNGSITTVIPDTCTGSCTPYLSLNGGGGFPGVVSSAANISVGGANPAAKVSGLNWKVAGESSESLVGFDNLVYDYAFFERKIESPQALAENPTGSDLNNLNGFYKVSGSGNLTIGSNFNVSSSKKIIILVPGNLRINNEVTVDEGGFLAFVVKGDIVFDKDLGVNPNANPASAKLVDGVFIANGFIKTVPDGETYNKNRKFIGKGIFIADANLDGDGGFNFRRNLEESNNLYPAEYFEYRPDFLVNFPKEMAVKRMVWTEVAP